MNKFIDLPLAQRDSSAIATVSVSAIVAVEADRNPDRCWVRLNGATDQIYVEMTRVNVLRNIGLNQYGGGEWKS